MHIFEKPGEHSLMAASDSSPQTRRLFIMDKKGNVRYIIDTGADVSVYPRALIRAPLKKTSFNLAAENNAVIATYGTTPMLLDLVLRRDFPGNFVIADITTPLIGVDFFAHFGLLVDLWDDQLIDKVTKLTSREVAQTDIPYEKVINLTRSITKYSWNSPILPDWIAVLRV